MKKLKYFIIFLVFIFSDLNLALAHICNVSNPILSFGQYDPRPGASNTSTSTVTVTCSDMKADVPYTLTLYKSKQAFSMSKGDDVMYFQLYTSVNYSTLWDENNTISGVVKNNAGNGSDLRTVYAKIIPNQIGKKSGAYNSATDPVIITLHYAQ
jgi:spore coat protein U-like protein